MAARRGLPALAVCALLAACDTSPEKPEPEPSAITEAEDAPALRIAGRYETTLADGTVVIQTISADGTYRETTGDGVETQVGRWRADGSDMCFDPEGDEPEICYAGGAPGADGSLQILDADGEPSTSVRRLADEAPANPPDTPDQPAN